MQALTSGTTDVDHPHPVRVKCTSDQRSKAQAPTIRIWAFCLVIWLLPRDLFLQPGAEGEFDERLLLHLVRLG